MIKRHCCYITPTFNNVSATYRQAIAGTICYLSSRYCRDYRFSIVATLFPCLTMYPLPIAGPLPIDIRFVPNIPLRILHPNPFYPHRVTHCRRIVPCTRHCRADRPALLLHRAFAPAREIEATANWAERMAKAERIGEGEARWRGAWASGLGEGKPVSNGAGLG